MRAGTTLGSRVRRGAALALLACGTAFSVTTPAHAAGELCDSGVVFDEADVLDDRAVSRTTRASFDDRVTVKVIAWEQTPGGGSLYDALVDARAQCAGWGFTGGGRRSLLVLGVSTGGRELGTHYDGWAFDRFDSSRDDVELGAMGPAFGNGQWTDGMVEGLRGYAEAYAAPSPTRGPEPYVPEIDDFADDFSSDGGGSAPSPWLLGVPVGLAAVGGGGYGAVRLRRRLKARAAARASLAHAVSGMAQAWFELDESNELIDARVSALPPVSDSVADGIRTAHAEAVATRDSATATYLRLSEVHTETAVAEMDTEEATQAGHEVEAATRELRGAQAAMAAVEERLSAYDTLREELPARIEALRTGAAEVTALLASRQVEGYRTTDNDAAPAAAEQAATDAAALAAQQRHGDAAALLERAQADLAAHRTWLSELADFRAALVRDTARSAPARPSSTPRSPTPTSPPRRSSATRTPAASRVCAPRSTRRPRRARRSTGPCGPSSSTPRWPTSSSPGRGRSSPQRSSPRTPSRPAPHTRRCGSSSCGRSRSTCRSASSGPSWRPTRSRARSAPTRRR